MHSPLLSAALQNSLTAALCHCKYTFEDLLITSLLSAYFAEQCEVHFTKASAALHWWWVTDHLYDYTGRCNFTDTSLL